MTGRLQFGDFTLDCADRRLTRNGAPVPLNARYMDALILMVGEAGKLVSKDRFHEQVWRGVPVTDEALTQCIRTLRRQLGDDAVRPRFIETVPKHGYRFVAEVRAAEPGPAVAGEEPIWRAPLRLALGGTAGAATAGLVGGILFGIVAASGGGGALSAFLVLLIATLLIATIGGAGVAFGIAAPELAGERDSGWSILSGAAGGVIVGGFVKLLAMDGFALLLGHAPARMTGAPEGALLGGAVGLGYWLAARRGFSVRRSAGAAAVFGACAGLLVNLLGGQLMAGSLDLLAQAMPGSRLQLDALGTPFGEAGFGPVSHAVTTAAEGALLAASMVAAMRITRR
ncbi:winged helix-turn-helix domain-containing protein [Stakelama tenebrarum]|uniref:Transcriptional regulator n=1 Tax=Stakelama tenebrarum TaxID=2711215 RepID=A0A6G6Y7U4_9SPHN|nr:transcriptional regulator [Sphingosinithalassobacter tenebrarum]QIG80643.1 transcriptional regulator [Sphingosinithalassobacter tenebrarum]